MDKNSINIRLMKADDFDAIVALDEKILKSRRPEFYAMKFEVLFKSKDYLPASLVAEDKDGKLVGFVMGEVFIGEYGIFEEAATLETIGVDPGHRGEGIGERLMKEFVAHLKALGIKKMYTLVGQDDVQLTRFFTANRFTPSKRISLERTL